jgi:hypothetical protein
MGQAWRQLPPDLAGPLAQALGPAHAEETALILKEAVALDDDALATFLSRLAERVRASPSPVTPAELRRMLPSPPDAEGRPPPP